MGNMYKSPECGEAIESKVVVDVKVDPGVKTIYLTEAHMHFCTDHHAHLASGLLEQFIERN